MSRIELKSIVARSGSQTESFEEFCCQLHRVMPEAPPGATWRRFRGAGGDGGVEAIWTLADGAIWGVQAKFVWKTDDKTHRQIADSILTACHNHSKLERYVICLPFDPTGPVAGGTRGRSQSEILDGWVSEWRRVAAALLGHELIIEWWTESEFLRRLAESDPAGGRRRYWFDEPFLSRSRLEERARLAATSAGPRYTPELSIATSAARRLHAFSHSESFSEDLDRRVGQMESEAERFVSIPRRPEFGEAAALAEALDQVRAAGSARELLRHGSLTATREKELQDALEAARSALTRIEEAVCAALEEKHGPGFDTAGFRQYHAEFMVDFPLSDLDLTRGLARAVDDLHGWLNDVGLLAARPVLLMRGPAGVGKTHAVVDLALECTRAGNVAAVVFGEEVGGDGPVPALARSLGLSPSLAEDELLDALDSAAQLSGGPGLLVFDALNETAPDRRRWRTWLPNLAASVTSRPNLKLLVTCRDSYLQDVLTERDAWPRIAHDGFAGVEHEAAGRFSAHYGLRPPPGPLLQAEYGNPLFLHLVCRGAKVAGRTALPAGGQGLDEVLGLILTAQNQRAAETLDYDPRENRVGELLRALCDVMAKAGATSLDLKEAKAVEAELFPAPSRSQSLLDRLERDGLLAVVPTGADHRLRFSFERIGDHMLAGRLLERAENPSALAALLTAEPQSGEQGLLEALAVVLPERWKLEIDEALPILDWHTALQAVLASLDWRDARSITPRTGELIQRALSDPATFGRALECLLDVAVRPDHALNANWLDDLLRRSRMVDRDPWWTGGLSRSHESKGAAWRLCEWGLRTKLDGLDPEAGRLWAVALAWCCASADRRVRDRATKALVRVLGAAPSAAAALIASFATVDDDAVLERVLLAAYGMILRGGQAATLGSLAAVIWSAMFRDGNPPLNVLLRDTGRLIVERAAAAGVLPDEVDLAKVKPPYASPWPLNIPAPGSLPEADPKLFPKLDMQRGIGEDFGRYVVKPTVLNDFDLPGLTLDDLNRWFLREVAILGYPGTENRCARFDRALIARHGPGRGKPIWAERLGKKYYWTLLARLVGQVSDHAPYGRYVEASDASLPSRRLRSIDPSDLRPWGAITPPVRLSLPAVPPLDGDEADREWVARDDFIQGAALTRVVDDTGRGWVPLSASFVLSNGDADKERERRLTADAVIIFTPDAQATAMARHIVGTGHGGDLSNWTLSDRRLYIGEYQYLLALPRLQLKRSARRSGSTLEVVLGVVELARDYDYDASGTPRTSTTWPSPEIVHELGLRWDGDRGWLDEEGELAAFCVAPAAPFEAGCYLREDLMLRFQRAVGLTAFLVWFQQRLVLGSAGANGSGYHEKKGSVRKNSSKDWRRNGKEVRDVVQAAAAG